MKVLLINSMSGAGSTGRIVEGISAVLNESHIENQIIYGLGFSKYPGAVKIGTGALQMVHKCISHAFDMQGLGSNYDTRRIIKYIESYKPDIVHLHTLHGNYINYPILFGYLSKCNVKVVWTFHDCWPFTGHCPHFAYIKCDRWQSHCHNCPQLWMYPKSDFYDGSYRNYRLKKKYFSSLGERLTIVTVSHWLANLVQESFFKGTRTKTIHNGIDISSFVPVGNSSLCTRLPIGSRKMILAVSAPWTKRKGFDDVLSLSRLLPTSEYVIVMVGLSRQQLAGLPSDIIGILRTESIEELVGLYSNASVLVNPTYEDSYPTVNLEALSCGTPVVTYDTGGSPESIAGDFAGAIVPKGNIDALAKAIIRVSEMSMDDRIRIRKYAEKNFDMRRTFSEYLNLYSDLVQS